MRQVARSLEPCLLAHSEYPPKSPQGTFTGHVGPTELGDWGAFKESADRD